MKKQPVKVLIWGFGAMGSGMARLILAKKGIVVAGICDCNPDLVGKSIFDILKLEPTQADVTIKADIADVLASAEYDVALLATDSYTARAYPKIKHLIEHKINVISTAEEMVFPAANEPLLTNAIDKLARKNNVTVLGAGINPGLMMDLLVIVLTAATETIENIKVSRINSLSPFGPTVMTEQGVGLTPEEFKKRQNEGKIAGHIGFKESVALIAQAVGLQIDSFQQTLEPIITAVERKSQFAHIKPGTVAGINMKAKAYINGKAVIEMNHPQQIEPQAAGIKTGDFIEINGKPKINLAVVPEVDGGIGTIAVCVNMIPHVINAAPGLKTMIDMPVPRAVLGDFKTMIKENENDL